MIYHSLSKIAFKKKKYLKYVGNACNLCRNGYFMKNNLCISNCPTKFYS